MLEKGKILEGLVATLVGHVGQISEDQRPHENLILIENSGKPQSGNGHRRSLIRRG